MEKTQTPVRIKWHSSDVDFRSINATLYMNGKGLFLGRAARMTTEDSDAPWLFWISDAVYGLFEAENFRPFLIQEAVPTLKDEKKKIESFVFLYLWKFAPLMKDFGHKEKAGLS